MRVIEVRNVEEALQEGLKLLARESIRRDSRNGMVAVMDGPVTTLYQHPLERVMLWPARDANPFFHLFEALWMLAGRQDVEYPARFAKRIRSYSDDGATLHGAYGYRWREFFGQDQLAQIAVQLEENADDRRCVLQMWDATRDLGRLGKDVPCNTQAYLWRDAEGRLDMTVTCRSNDMIWGGYGANAVHFSVLQEYLAAMIGCEVGRMWQVSNNYHMYEELYVKLLDAASWGERPYEEMVPTPLISTSIETWNEDLADFLEDKELEQHQLADPFFSHTAWPMLQAWKAHKAGSTRAALNLVGGIDGHDWRRACSEWLQRRYDAVS